jgi:hypothetical protein
MGKFGLVAAVVGTLAFASSAMAEGGCFGASHKAQSSSPVVVATTPLVAPTTTKKEG